MLLTVGLLAHNAAVFSTSSLGEPYAAVMTLNVLGWMNHWDPYPFILLNLVLSFQAAFATPSAT